MFDDEWTGYALFGIVMGLVGVCLRSFAEFRRRSGQASFPAGRNAGQEPPDSVQESFPDEEGSSGLSRQRRLQARRKAMVSASGHRSGRRRKN